MLAPFREGAEAVKETGGDTLTLCYQCGLCSSTCPWNTVKSFFIRRLVHQAQLGLVEFEDEGWWFCSTCGACVMRCPRGVEIIDIMEAVRQIMVQGGAVPASLRSVMASLGSEGNPWREARERRADWAIGLDIKAFTKDTELLYFPCCTTAYDSKARRIAQATVAILRRVGVDFGILGSKENCCGESIRKAGNESLFQQLARSNIETFRENGVRKIIVSSPHCFHTFKKEYPELGGDFEVVHFVQYLREIIQQGKLEFSKELNRRVTYHDPCYLGRHNNIYDEPREVLRHIPGLEFVEMRSSRENSICCGGGGGGIWMETKKGERLSDLRIEEAIEARADIIATCCPYCLINFEDSILTSDKSDIIEAKDISELVREVI